MLGSANPNARTDKRGWLRQLLTYTGPLAAALATCLLCTTCAGRGGPAQHADGPSVRAGAPLTGTTAEGMPALAAPADLIKGGAPRNASYTEADIAKVGSDFDATLPNNLVSPDGDNGAFQPDFQEGDPVSQAAYCIYRFNAAGFDRTPDVRMQWTTAPAAGTLYVALADWSASQWRWFSADPGAPLGLGDIQPYINVNGDVAVVVFCTGSADSALTVIRLGGQPPVIAYSVTGDTTSFVPLSITIDASGSSDPDGQIVKFEWDLDGDGTFELNGGMDTPQQVEANEPRGFYVQLRATDDDGLVTTRQIGVRALAEWTHSWGGGGRDDALDVNYDGLNSIYVTGWTNSYGAGGKDLVLVKYDLAGELVWQHTWGGGGDEVSWGSALDSDGNLIMLTRRDPQRAVLVKFTPGGEVAWANEYGFLANNFQPGALDVHGTDIYFTGNQTGSGDLPSAVVAKIGGDGQPLWVKRWNGGAVDIGAIQSYAAAVVSRGVAVAGRVDEDVLLLLLKDEDGSMLAAKTWGGTDDESATGLAITGPFNPEFWLTGVTFSGGFRVPFLLQYASSPFCKTWYGGIGPDHDELPCGVLRQQSGDLLIGGLTASFDAGDDGLFLRFSNSGIIQSSVRLTRPSSDLTVWGIAQCTSKAVLCAGTCNAANGATWESADGTVGSISHDWQDYASTLEGMSVAVTPQSGTLGTPSGAILDTGAGDDDMLVSLRQVP